MLKSGRVSAGIVLAPLCFALAWYAYAGPFAPPSIATACTHAPLTRCIADQVAQIIATDGVQTGFEALIRAQRESPEIARECYSITTAAADAVYGRGVSYEALPLAPEAAYCNNSFIKEFALLTTEHMAEPAAGKRYCEYVRSENLEKRAVIDCYRGVGFALPRLVASTQQVAVVHAALEICEELRAPDDETVACVQGVFDHVSRAEPAVAAPDYEPFGICDTVPVRYMSSCIGTYKGSLFSEMEHASSTPEYLQSIEKRYAGTAHLQELRDLLARWAGYQLSESAMPNPDYQNMLDACAALPSDLSLSCIQGAASGFSRIGTPGATYREVVRFCDAAATPDCADANTLDFLRDSYPPEVFMLACRALRAASAEGCMAN